MSETLEAISVGVTLGGRAILKGIDLAFRRGEVNVLIGPNGAGKSTLINCLAGLKRPDMGQVRLGGAPIEAIPRQAVARRLALLPQHSDVVWPVDVETLVGLGRIPHQGFLGPTPADRAAVQSALAQMEVEPLARRSYHTLSGGERSRVLMARALAGEPDWILADEPLTGLDPGVALDVAESLRALARSGHGVIVTLHDLGLAARLADRIVVLKDGKTLADGPGAEALSKSMLSVAFGVQVRISSLEGQITIDLLARVRPT